MVTCGGGACFSRVGLDLYPKGMGLHHPKCWDLLHASIRQDTQQPSFAGGGRYSYNRCYYISKWVMQWVRVRVNVSVSVNCAFSEAFCRNRGCRNSGLYPVLQGDQIVDRKIFTCSTTPPALAKFFLTSDLFAVASLLVYV